MRLSVWLAVGSTVCAFAVVGGLAGVAAADSPPTSVVVNESFTGASVSTSWKLPGVPSGESNQACLTGGTGGPVPGCSSAGSQAGLQLTTATTDQEGGLYYGSSVPSALGLDATFDSYQYGGTGADGIVFFLAASNGATASPITLGSDGGYLGYYQDGTAVDGLTNGYLGVGLDAYGNYANGSLSGSGCGDSSTGPVPQSVVVRGPGTGTSGYCLQDSQQLSGSLNAATATKVPVEVAVNPTGAELTTASGIDVPAGQYVVKVTPIGSSAAITIKQPLPSASGILNSVPLDTNGVPTQLTFGWSAATGASTDFHTVSNVNVTTLAPTATALSIASQPVDTQAGANMTNPGGGDTHILVDADLSGGAIDPNYNGLVTLGFANNPGNASFAGGSSTMTATAVNGVADFSPIVVNNVGFGYTLQASATGLTPATTAAFSVSAAATSCASGTTCTASTTSSSTGDTATVQGLAGSGDAIISATYGGNVAPIYPCKGTSGGILTFSGDRQKLVTLTMQIKVLPVLLFCYGQPTPFRDITLRMTTHYNAANQEYEGLLPACLPRLSGPCVKSLKVSKHVETVVIVAGAADPHVSRG